MVIGFQLWLKVRREEWVMSDVCASRCSFRELKRLTGINVLRVIDLMLIFESLKKSQASVETAEHFDPCMTVMSELRKAGLIKSLDVWQHGLIELPRFDASYQKIFCDRFTTLDGASNQYIKGKLCQNPTVEIMEKEKGKINWLDLNRQGWNYVFAVALQNDNHEADSIIVEECSKAAMEYGALLIIYPHPASKNKDDLNSLLSARGILVERVNRYKNIDLCVTRYSTLGLDYHKLRVPVLFVPFGEMVCIFESGAFQIIDDTSSLREAVKSVLMKGKSTDDSQILQQPENSAT